jgi:hypothetical protein
MSEVSRPAYSAVAIAMLVLHVLLRPLLHGLPISPDLLTGGVLVGGLVLRAGSAAILGFTAGLIEAALSVGGLGPLTLVYTLLGYGSARSRDLIFADLQYFLLAYLFVGTWMTQLVLAALAGSSLSWMFAFVVAPLSALLTAVLGELGARAASAITG